MILQNLKDQVLEANLKLVKYGLVTLTWGNVSAIDRTQNYIVIKPSGVDYNKMTAEDMVVVDLEGRIVEGKYRPSSDVSTHIKLYKAFSEIGGISHTHSKYATMFAQAHLEIPCFGTTHADHFCGNVPLARILTEEEVNEDYGANTGKVIIERFKNINPMSIPGVLLESHAPFTWGKDASESVNHSLILERIAEMAYGTLQLNPNTNPLEQYILDKHYNRKHGVNSSYGQKQKNNI